VLLIRGLPCILQDVAAQHAQQADDDDDDDAAPVPSMHHVQAAAASLQCQYVVAVTRSHQLSYTTNHNRLPDHCRQSLALHKHKATLPHCDWHRVFTT
jgi:hypothetical protein